MKILMGMLWQSRKETKLGSEVAKPSRGQKMMDPGHDTDGLGFGI